MNTTKVAITIPRELLIFIDNISKKKGMSRSKYISTVLHDEVSNENAKQLKDAYNRVFSDEAVRKEQLETAAWLEGVGSKEGQEW